MSGAKRTAEGRRSDLTPWRAKCWACSAQAKTANTSTTSTRAMTSSSGMAAPARSSPRSRRHDDNTRSDRREMALSRGTGSLGLGAAQRRGDARRPRRPVHVQPEPDRLRQRGSVRGVCLRRRNGPCLLRLVRPWRSAARRTPACDWTRSLPAAAPTTTGQSMDTYQPRWVSETEAACSSTATSRWSPRTPTALQDVYEWERGRLRQLS